MMPFDQNPISLLWSIDEHHLMKSPMYLTDKTVRKDLDTNGKLPEVEPWYPSLILYWLNSNHSETI